MTTETRGGRREGAGRPIVNRTAICARMDPDLADALRARAKADKESLSDAVEKAVRAYLGEWTRIEDGDPPCDGEALFIGVNDAGFACIFNVYSRVGKVCLIETAEGIDCLMSGLAIWKPFALPEVKP